MGQSSQRSRAKSEFYLVSIGRVSNEVSNEVSMETTIFVSPLWVRHGLVRRDLASVE